MKDIDRINRAADHDRETPPDIIQVGGASNSGARAGTYKRIAIVDNITDRTGGHYNCYLQKLDAAKWDSATDDQLEQDGENTVVVLNLLEVECSDHDLKQGEQLVIWQETDNEGNSRWVGLPVVAGGETIRRVKVQATPTTSVNKVSVKICDGSDTVPAEAEAFDMYLLGDKASIDYSADQNEYIELPKVDSVCVACKDQNGDWYLKSPALLYIGDSTRTVSSTAENIGGRFISRWVGTW